MRFTIKTASTLTLVLLVLLTFTGCKRQRAENSLRKTVQKLSTIESNYEGLTHVPNEIQGIRTQIDAANSQLATDPGLALTTAKAAGASADQLLEQVKPIEARARYARAQREIEVSDINDLPRREPERYARIRDLKLQADTASQENQWDEVISLSQQIIDEATAGLAQLLNDANRRRNAAEQALTTLKSEGGNLYAPEVVIAVTTDIDAAIKISDEDRDYVLAANKFSEAANKADQGVVQVLRRRSREAIDEIESYIAEALIEGAKQFRNDQYNKVNELYENVLINFEEGKYKPVLEASKLLLEDAKVLVVETKRAASDDRIQAMEANIRELEVGGILEYIPGSLDTLRGQLANAREIRTRDTEEAFNEIKQISIDAADEYDRQRGNFEALALDAIREARNSLETTTAVFNEMDNIFDPVAGEMTPEQRAFENQKRSRQSELGERIRQASGNLATADLRKQNGEFRGSIVLAREVKNESETVLNEVYHTVAHNAAIELAGLISRYERDGARQYAVEELQRSTMKLDEVKQTIAQGSHKRAVELAAEARADVELMAQRIAGRATEDLREARNTLDSASSENTRRFRGEELDQVQRLIEQAQQDLQADRLKIALETAQQATQRALQAEREANMMAAEESLNNAAAAIARAQQAGAELYAGREMEESRRLINSARSLFQNQEYVRANELAKSSNTRAENALFKKVNDAEAEIATAEAIGAWDFNYTRLANANTKVLQSRAALEGGEFDRSRSLAESAEADARSLVADTKRHNFNSRVSRIRENLATGTIQGLNFFQPEESIAIRRRLVELENAYDPNDYERVIAQIELLESELRTTLNTTDDLVTTVADQLDERLTMLAELGAVNYAAVEIAQARDNLRYARLDYRRGDYKAAHSYLTKAIGLTREVESRVEFVRYSGEIQTLFDEYEDAQARFANVLTLAPAELKELAVMPNGSAQSIAVSGRMTPRQFRDSVDELYSRALVVNVPPGLEKLHEIVINAFEEGRAGAQNFEKLVILNRVPRSEAFSLIDSAYHRMNVSNNLVAGVQQQIIANEFQFTLVEGRAGSLVNSFADR